MYATAWILNSWKKISLSRGQTGLCLAVFFFFHGKNKTTQLNGTIGGWLATLVFCFTFLGCPLKHFYPPGKHVQTQMAINRFERCHVDTIFFKSLVAQWPEMGTFNRFTCEFAK